MDTKKAIGFEIEDGPSRDLIIDVFKYTYDNSRISVGFKFSAGHIGGTKQAENKRDEYYIAKIGKFRITRLAHEDGSGYSFNMSGDCNAIIFGVSDGGDKPSIKPYGYTAWYNAKSRKGHIRFMET